MPLNPFASKAKSSTATGNDGSDTASVSSYTPLLKSEKKKDDKPVLTPAQKQAVDKETRMDPKALAMWMVMR